MIEDPGVTWVFMAQVVLNNRSAEVASLCTAKSLIVLHVGKSWLASENAFSGWVCCSEVRPLRQGDFPAQAGVQREKLVAGSRVALNLFGGGLVVTERAVVL